MVRERYLIKKSSQQMIKKTLWNQLTFIFLIELGRFHRFLLLLLNIIDLY